MLQQNHRQIWRKKGEDSSDGYSFLEERGHWEGLCKQEVPWSKLGGGGFYVQGLLIGWAMTISHWVIHDCLSLAGLLLFCIGRAVAVSHWLGCGSH